MSKLQFETQSTKDLGEEEVNQHSKRSFFIELSISIIYTIIKMTLLAVVLGFASSISAKQFMTSDSYLRVQENLWLWQQQIIIDFTVVQGYNCPEGYQEYTNFSWAGNIQGCFCRLQVGLFEYEAVLQGRCGQRQFARGCLSVPSNSQMLFRFWQPQAHLCIKRLQNYNFYFSESDIINPLGYNMTNCSPSADYQIDLIQAIPCPVTNILNDSSLNQSIPVLNYSFQRQTGYPIVHFRISEYAFCQSFTEYDISPGRISNYILENNYKYECSKKDTRTVILSTQGEAKFFRNNPKLYQITQTLPAYPHLTDEYVYNLGFVRYPAWIYSCRNSHKYNLNIAQNYLSLIQIESIINIFQILILVGTLVNFTIIIYYWVSCYFYLKTKYMHGYLYLKDYQIKKNNPHTNIIRNRQTELKKFLAFEICPPIIIVFLTILYFNLNLAKAWFANVYPCTQQSFVDYLQSYQRFLGGEMVVVMSCIFVNIGVICLDVCYLLWRYFKGDLQQEEQRQEQVNSISKTTNQQLSIINVCDFDKQINLTEECLIQNDFEAQNDKKINIYMLDDEDKNNISEYSQSSRKSD